MSPGALDGIKIFEFASYVSGPYAGMLLSDLGAEIVKVETPDGGDPFRMWAQDRLQRHLRFDEPQQEERDARLEDRGRQSGGRASSRSAPMSRSKTCAPAPWNASGSGTRRWRPTIRVSFIARSPASARSGPYRDRPGYDTIGQAVSGLLSVLTDRKAPQPMGVSLSDHLAGAFAAYGVLAALMARTTTGRGQKVETSLLQATLSFLGENAATFFEDGNVPSRQSRCRRAQVFTFTAGDGLPFAVHLSSPEKFWRGLLVAMKREALAADDRFPVPGTAGQELRCAVRRTRRNVSVATACRMADAARGA